ncbi:hypothetical protein F5B21DRAFT_477276, partial [Xylaria acuta]
MLFTALLFFCFGVLGLACLVDKHRGANLRRGLRPVLPCSLGGSVAQEIHYKQKSSVSIWVNRRSTGHKLDEREISHVLERFSRQERGGRINIL